MRPNRHAAVLFALLLSTAFTFAQAKKATKHAAGPGPDKAHLQKIWDGWATLNVPGQAQFYAQGAHTFFDIAPLKYANWDEYQKGATALVSNYKSATFTVNDDAEFHSAGDSVWGTATVKSDMVAKTGLHEMSTFRWTYVFQNQDGKWLVVHEHISAPLQ
jgi:ketosteroid isomerase-like protein